MTKREAYEIIKRHQQESVYYTCALGCGEVSVISAAEDGFVFYRRTEYVETIGVYNQFYATNDIYDSNAYAIAEVVMRRKEKTT